MKSVAIVGLALVGGAVARGTNRPDRHLSDPRITFPQANPSQILTAHDDEFGIVNVKTDVQTVVMPGNRGAVTIGRDDADNELDMHFNVPNNRGNFAVNDYTVRKDAEDDEFGIVDVKTDIQTVVMPGNRGPVTIRRDAEDDEYYVDYDDEFGIVDVKTDVQTVVMPGNRGRVTIGRDDADNELDMHFNVPNNRGNFQVNDYTKTHDDDEMFLHLDIKSDVQTVVMPGNHGPVTIKRDDADNELDMHFNVPNNRGNFQVNDYTKTHDDEHDNELHMHFNVPNNRGQFEVNDYTVRKDAEDDEFGIVDVKTDIQTVVMPGNRGPVTIRRDAEDDEYYVDYDDEFGIVNVKTDVQTVVMPGNRGAVTIGRDDADNELDMHFNVPNNRGNFVVNDYTVKKDAEDDEYYVDYDDEFGIVDVKTDIQTVVMPGNRGRVTIGRDDADNELDMHFNVPNNRGNFQVNDYTKTHDDFDDEFGIVNVKTDLQTVVMPGNHGPVTIKRDAEDDEFFADYDDEFAVTGPKHLKKDEIDHLASLLKLATQDKDGNVVIDGVKIGKIPQKVEAPKPRKFLAY